LKHIELSLFIRSGYPEGFECTAHNRQNLTVPASVIQPDSAFATRNIMQSSR